MEIYRTAFVVRTLDSSQKAIHSKWLAKTADMEVADFQYEMQTLVELMIRYQTKLLLSDLREMLFFISPEQQVWVVQTIIPQLIAMGFKRQAIVLPKDLFAQVSLEQAIEEAIEQKVNHHQTRFFENSESASEWLMGYVNT